MVKIIKSLFYKLYLCLAVAVIFFAVIMSVSRSFSPILNHHKALFEHWASQALDKNIKISSVKLIWRGFEPVFEFSEVQLQNKVSLNSGAEGALPARGDNFEIQHLDIGIDLFASMVHKRMELGSLTVDGVNLSINQDEKGNFKLAGFSTDSGKKTQQTTVKFEQIIAWFITQRHFVLKNLNLDLINQTGVHLDIRKINVNIIDRGDKHQIVGDGLLFSNSNTAQLSFVVNATGDWQKNLDNKAAEIYVNAENIKLQPVLNELMLKDMQIKDGLVNFEAWGFYKNNKWVRVQANLKINNVQLEKKDASQSINLISGNYMWLNTNLGWKLLADKIAIATNEKVWPTNYFNVSYEKKQVDNPAILKFQADLLPIDQAQVFLLSSQILPEKIQNTLTQIDILGDLKNLYIEHLFGVPPAQGWKVHADFNDLLIKGWENIPGISDINGHLKIAPDEGEFFINSDALKFKDENFFSNPVPLGKLSAQFNWVKDSLGWAVQSKNINLENTDLSVIGSAGVQLYSDKRSPQLNILFNYQMKNLNSINKYLPDKKMNPKLVAWLQDALTSGKIANGQLVLRGQMKDFPYDKQPGVFRASADFNDVILTYRKNWPEIKNLYGTLNFTGRSMSFTSSRGEVFGIPIQALNAAIPHIEKGVRTQLNINGKLKTDTRYAFRFINASPLKSSLGDDLSIISMQGPMLLDLQLGFAFGGGHTDSSVSGTIAMTNNILAIPGVDMQFNAINGKLQFNETDLTAQGITALLFNKPVNFNVKTLKLPNKKSTLEIALKGNLNVNDIKNKFSLGVLNYASGSAAVEAILDFPRDDADASNTLNILSDLSGVSVMLPQPYGKMASEKTLMNFSLVFGANQSLLTKIDYGKYLNAVLVYPKLEGKYQFEKGNIRLGGATASIPKGNGISVDGTIPIIKWSEWQSLLENKSDASAPTNNNSKQMLRSVNIMVGSLQAFGQDFKSTNLALFPETNSWLASFSGDSILGTVMVPLGNKPSPIDINFKKLYLSSNKDDKTNLKTDPKKIPAINFNVSDLHHDKKHMGRVHLTIRPTAQGIHIGDIKATTNTFSVSASGDWNSVKLGQQSAFYGKLTSNDLGGMFQDFGLAGVMNGKNGDVTFSFAWPDSPSNWSFKKLNGSVSFELNQARFVKLDQDTQTKMGFAQLLTIFSFDSIARRLRLDFSDIGGKGFYFDDMSGDFRIVKGNAYTSNTKIRGPVANVDMYGRVGFAAEDYDLTLQISTNVTSSLPLVAAIAGGPVAGAVGWVVNKALSPQLSKMMMMTYRVSGPWKMPVIEKMAKQN